MKTVKLGLMLFCVGFLISGKAPEYKIGDPVSEFRLKNVDGKMISLSDYNTAKGLIIIFDCNTCPFSKAYRDRIIDLNEKYASQGVSRSCH